MNLILHRLTVRARQGTEVIEFAKAATFIHGPVSTGKSTVASLINFCFGGELEETPAIQSEFVAAELSLTIGNNQCLFERGGHDTQSIRVTWTDAKGNNHSVNAPLAAGEQHLIMADVFNFSDLIFFLAGQEPIMVRKRMRDPDSEMVRLSIRDIWRYCYLDQTHLDSSFFRLEDPFRGRKSQDSMRFFTGLHSDRLSQLEGELYRHLDDKRGKIEAAEQIRRFMDRFGLGTEADIMAAEDKTKTNLQAAELERTELEQKRQKVLHPTDALRTELRSLGEELAGLEMAVADSLREISQQKALQAELITTKMKAQRTERANTILDGAVYAKCPQCGTNLESRNQEEKTCSLCLCDIEYAAQESASLDVEVARRELNDRIDQLANSINMRELALDKTQRQLFQTKQRKVALDQRLQKETARYDSAYIESIRGLDQTVATLAERLRSLESLQEMPKEIAHLNEEAALLQVKVANLRCSVAEEKARLSVADKRIQAIGETFHAILLSVGFPGVSPDDEVVLDPRNWRPSVVHGEQVWSFWNAGSGGKRTLFNVCYALAIHEVAVEYGMPVPTLLIIDSPTKNISEDENPDLVRSLYQEVYRIASKQGVEEIQFLLIDSDLVEPVQELSEYTNRRMAGEAGAPRLISYYEGP